MPWTYLAGAFDVEGVLVRAACPPHSPDAVAHHGGVVCEPEREAALRTAVALRLAGGLDELRLAEDRAEWQFVRAATPMGLLLETNVRDQLDLFPIDLLVGGLASPGLAPQEPAGAHGTAGAAVG